MTSTPPSPNHADELIADDLRVDRSWMERADTVELSLSSSAAVPQAFSARLPAGQKYLELLNAARHELAGSDSDVQPIDYSAPAQIGGFQITGRPRVGGFGMVFPARDSEMHRDVAIKLPKPEFLGMPDFIERFTREAQAAAQLDHHNIVPVFSYGRYGISPYLVMPFIHGQTLASWRSSQAEIAPRMAAEIVRQLAEGVAHAHAQGVLHRDIKPGNVLLEPRRAAVDNDQLPFQPKLTDFGLAKFLDDAHPPTQAGIVLGTLGYMSPEQAATGSAQIGVGMDIYSLGAVLYFLITGAPPAVPAANSPDDSNSSLSLIQRGFQVPVELDVICQQCLEHSPDRRYASASLLADDLRRFLAGEPILARPISSLRRCVKWCRRHPAWATLLSATAVSVVTLIATSLWYNSRLSEQLQISEQARRTSQQQEQEMRRRAYVSDMALASRAWNTGNVSQTLNLLERHRPQGDEPDLRNFVWHYLWRQYHDSSKVIGQHAGRATAAAMTADGRWGASSGADGVIRIWSLPDSSLHREFIAPDADASLSLEFSPAGHQLAAVGQRGTVAVYEIPSCEILCQWVGHEGSINDVAYSHDGTLIATAGADRVIRLWNPQTGESTGNLTGHTGIIEQIAFHPDRKTLASTSKDATVRLWDLQRRVPDDRVAEGILHRTEYQWPRTLVISPDGQHLMTHVFGDVLVLLSLQESSFGQREPLPPDIERPPENIRAMVWPRKNLWIGGTTQLLESRVLHRRSGVYQQKGHKDSILGLAATADGTQWFSTAADGEIRHWQVTGNRYGLITPNQDGQSRHYLEDSGLGLSLGRRLMTQMILDDTSDTTVSLLNHMTGAIEKSLTIPRRSHGVFHLTNNDRHLLELTPENQLDCIDVQTGRSIWQAKLPSRLSGHSHSGELSSAPHLAAIAINADVLLYSLNSGDSVQTIAHPEQVHCILLLSRPDEPVMLVTVCRDGYLRCWNAETGKLIRENLAHRGGVVTLDASRDGKLFATGGRDRMVRVWNADELTELHAFHIDGSVKLGFFGPHNHLICGEDTLSIWSLDGPTELMEFSSHYHPVNWALSPDKNTLALQYGGKVDLILADE